MVAPRKSVVIELQVVRVVGVVHLHHVFQIVLRFFLLPLRRRHIVITVYFWPLDEQCLRDRQLHQNVGSDKRVWTLRVIRQVGGCTYAKNGNVCWNVGAG